MSDKATLTDEQIAEYEAIFKENRPVISQWSIGLKVIAALRASQERVKELESIMTIWNQEELDEAEKRAEMTKTLFDQAERVKVLEEVADWITSNVNDCWFSREQANELFALLKKARKLK